MPSKAAVSTLLLLVLLAVSGCTSPGEQSLPSVSPVTPPPGQTYQVTVVSVVDGDTVDVEFANGSTGRVRLLGIDTPEVHVAVDPTQYEGLADTDRTRECLRSAGEDASAVVRSRLDGEQVTLSLDATADSRGGYGRILGYISHEGTNVNLALLRGGHARVYDSQFGLGETFDAAESEARAGDRGLWAC